MSRFVKRFRAGEAPGSATVEPRGFRGSRGFRGFRGSSSSSGSSGLQRAWRSVAGSDSEIFDKSVARRSFGLSVAHGLTPLLEV